jgi:GNAT superfamily N-acetyltransferase
MRDGAATITVRRAEESDLAALAHLHEGHPTFERYGLDSPGLAQALSRAVAAGDGIVLAERARRPLGVAWWCPHGAFARSPYLRLLIVAADEVGRGVGSRLMDAVELEAFATATDLFLLVTRDNEPAQRFYLRRRFALVGTLESYVAPGVDEVIMRKLGRHHGGNDPSLTAPPA